MLFSPKCSAIRDSFSLADNVTTANINALRIRKEYEGKGHISSLIRLIENYAIEHGYSRLTIGVEVSEYIWYILTLTADDPEQRFSVFIFLVKNI